jgi:fatty-acyl-CoA synthase
MSAGPIARDLIARGAQAHGDRVALVCGAAQWTFAEVDARANRLAHALAAVGAGKGARVALLLGNGPDSVPVDFACTKAGVNRVPLNPRLSPAEHARMAADAGCTLLVHGDDLAKRAAALAAAMPGLAAHGMAELWAIAAGEPDRAPDVALGPDDLLLTLYTSGTTGVLKAAQHSQGSYAAVARNVLLNLFPVAPDERMLHAASLIHASGTFVLPLWLRGGASVVLPGFVPGGFLAAVERHRATAVHLVPTMLAMLLDDPAVDAHDLSSLRHIVYGASPMPGPLIERAIARFGRERFWQYYGQTEAPLCLAVLRPDDHVPGRLGSAGRPSVDIEVRVVDPLGRAVAPGEAGEVLVRGPSMARGYHAAPELTAATFDADGWVHTRDLGAIDADGFLHLRDRTSDMIVTGGYNVYTREVEEALRSHPDVADAGVVGVAHPTWVEAVAAFVVPRPGAAPEPEALAAHVGARLAAYKKPRMVRLINALPLTAIGKLDRKALRALA